MFMNELQAVETGLDSLFFRQIYKISEVAKVTGFTSAAIIHNAIRFKVFVWFKIPEKYTAALVLNIAQSNDHLLKTEERLDVEYLALNQMQCEDIGRTSLTTGCFFSHGLSKSKTDNNYIFSHKKQINVSKLEAQFKLLEPFSVISKNCFTLRPKETSERTDLASLQQFFSFINGKEHGYFIPITENQLYLTNVGFRKIFQELAMEKEIDEGSYPFKYNYHSLTSTSLKALFEVSEQFWGKDVQNDYRGLLKACDQYFLSDITEAALLEYESKKIKKSLQNLLNGTFSFKEINVLKVLLRPQFLRKGQKPDYENMAYITPELSAALKISETILQSVGHKLDLLPKINIVIELLKELCPTINNSQANVLAKVILAIDYKKIHDI